MERIVTNTLVNMPPGAAVPPTGAAAAPLVPAAHEGGSLMDTFIVPMPGATMELLPPPQLMATVATPAKNTKAMIRDIVFCHWEFIAVFTDAPSQGDSKYLRELRPGTSASSISALVNARLLPP